MIFPRQLALGDKIAILSPASIINPEYVEGACRWLLAQGYRPTVMPHALGHHGSYSGSTDERLADLRAALADPQVRAILCSRGGYGAVQLIADFPVAEWLADPRWLIGFSDISALHALLNANGIVSIHASMCKALTREQGPDRHDCNHSCGGDAERLLAMLRGERPAYAVAPHPSNHAGTATGQLRGGNLAVIADLIATPISPFRDPENTILFIEDIAEPIYKVERILWQLRLMGFLDRVAAVVVGQFTDYRPNANHSDMYSMIAAMLAPLRCPVAFDFPVGHVDSNLPLLCGAEATLSVAPDEATLKFH